VYKHTNNSELVVEVVNGWNTSLESLSLSDSFDDLVGLGTDLKRISGHLLPMIKDTLWESSS